MPHIHQEALESWLQAHHQSLLVMAGREVTPSIAAEWLYALSLAVHKGVPDPLYPVLDEWLKAYSYHDQVMHLLNLHQGVNAALRNSLPPEDAQACLTVLEPLFSQSVLYMYRIEVQAVAQSAFQEANRARRKAQRLDRRKGDFTSIASHELKTPLTLIDGYANMLKMEVDEAENPFRAGVVNKMVVGTQRMLEVINDMIDVSALDMGLMSMQLESVNLLTVMDIAVSQMSKSAAERNLYIDLNKDSFPMRPIQADQERLHKVFVEVLENAIKFTPDGGVIQVEALETMRNVEIRVQDGGIGIAPDDIELIFEKFYTVGEVGLHSTSKTRFKGGGSGLGLAIARGIVEAHGGSIRAESPGYDEIALPGTCIYIILPFIQGNPT